MCSDSLHAVPSQCAILLNAGNSWVSQRFTRHAYLTYIIGLWRINIEIEIKVVSFFTQYGGKFAYNFKS